MILNSWKVIIAAMESRLKVKNSEVVKENKNSSESQERNKKLKIKEGKNVDLNQNIDYENFNQE